MRQTPPQNTSSIEQHTKKVFIASVKFKRWLFGSLGGFILLVITLLIALQWTFTHHTDDILGTVLREVIEIKSKGRYELNYDSIRLDVLRGKLYVENVKIIPDFSKIPLNKDKIHIEIPNMEVSTASLWKAYFKKEIKLYDIQIRHPFIEIYQKIDTQVENDSLDNFKIDNLYYLIDSYANLLEINHFMIHDGKFVIKDPQNKHAPLTLQHIFLEIKNFRVNHETNNPKRPFDTEDIKLRLSKNSIPIAHGDYTLLIGEAKLETSIQHIVLKDISFIPKEKNFKDKNTIQLMLPSINFLGVDFKEAYLHKKLNIREILLSNCFVRFQEDGIKKAKTDTLKISPYQYISKYLHQINISKIHLDNAGMDINLNKNGKKSHIEQHGIYLSLHHFLLDSIHQNERNDKFFIDDFDLEIPKFEQNFKKYFITANDLKISSKNSFISFKDLRLKNFDKKLRVQIKDVNLENILIWKLLLNKELSLSKINIKNPSIEIEIENKKVEKIDNHSLFSFKNELNHLSHKISPIIKKISIDNINIDNANFNLIDIKSSTHFIFDSLDLDIEKLHIPQYHPERQGFFISKNLQINVKSIWGNLPDTLHQIAIQNFSFDAQKGILSTKKIHLQPIDSLYKQKILYKNLFSYKTKSLNIEGLNLHEILVDSIIHLKNIHIHQPDFKVIKKETRNLVEVGLKNENTDNSFFNFKKVQIENILIDKGKFDIENTDKELKLGNTEVKDIEICVQNFQFDSLEWINKKLFIKYEDFIASTGEFHHYLTDSVHKIGAEYWSFDAQRKNLQLNNFSISPKSHLSENQSIYIEGQFPIITLDGVNMNSLQNKEINLDSIFVVQNHARWIVKPKSVIHSQKDSIDIGLANQFNQIISKLPFKYLKIGKTNIELNNSELFQLSDNTAHSVCKKIVLKLDNTYLDSTLKISPDNYYFSNNVELKLDDMNYQSSTKNQLFTLHKLFLSLKEDSINLEKIGFQPLLRKEESPSQISFLDKNIINSNIENINISKIGLYEFLFENKLNVHHIHIKQPFIKITSAYQKSNHQKSKNDSAFNTDSIPFIVKKIFSESKINHFTIENATFYTHKYHLNKTDFSIYPNIIHQKQQIPHIYLDIKQWDLDDSLSLLNTKDISFNIRNLEFPMADSLNNIVAKNIGFSTSKKQIFADSLGLAPRYSEREYAWKSGDGADRIAISSKKILFSNVDFKELIENQKFISDRLVLNNLNINVFGDRTAPTTPSNKTKYLLPSMLKKIPMYLKIDSIFWNNGCISYEEYAGEMDYKSSDSTYNIIQNSGYISLNKLQTLLTGITNDSILIAQGAKVQLNAQLQLMENGGNAFIEIDIPLNDIEEGHSIKGVVTEMPLNQINPLLEKLAFIKVKNGFLKGLDFQFNANHHYAKGWMKFRYQDLKISILNSKKLKGSQYKEDRFLSFFANNLFIRPDNPRMLFLKKGEIYQERDAQKSMINYWVRTLLSGVISSITPKKQKPSDLMKDEVSEDEKNIKIENKRKKKESKMKKNQIEIEE
jgi:hypothetical protein